MKCTTCGHEFENAKFCPECGAPAQAVGPAPAQPVSAPVQPQMGHMPPQAGQFPPQNGQVPPPYPPNPQPAKKKGGCLKVGLIVLGVIIVIGVIAAIAGGGGSNNSSSLSKSSAPMSSASSAAASTASPIVAPSSKAAAPSMEPYSTELKSGHYTAGIDFPAGTYTITWVSGSGNVNSSNMYSGGLNEIFSDGTDGMGITEFKNAKLDKGVVLSISSVTVSIASDAADTGNLNARENPLTEEVALGSGNHVAGTDFPAGVYDVVAVSGSGNVSSDNMYDGGLNAIMGPVDDGFNESTYKNIILSDGVTLTISGVEIKLVPSI